MTAPYAPRHARPANPPGEARADQWRGRPAGESGAPGTAPDPGGHPYTPGPEAVESAGSTGPGAADLAGWDEICRCPGICTCCADTVGLEWWWR